MPEEKKVGLMTQLRAKLEAGEAVRQEDFPNTSKVNFQGMLANLRSSKYCGKGRLPLNIVRAKDGSYSLWKPAQEEAA